MQRTLTQYHGLKKKFNPKRREAENKNESSQRWTERVISTPELERCFVRVIMEEVIFHETLYFKMMKPR
jgi:hypothetical protein